MATWCCIVWEKVFYQAYSHSVLTMLIPATTHYRVCDHKKVVLTQCFLKRLHIHCAVVATEAYIWSWQVCSYQHAAYLTIKSILDVSWCMNVGTHCLLLQTQMSVLRVEILVRRMQNARMSREDLCVSVCQDMRTSNPHASVSSHQWLILATSWSCIIWMCLTINIKAIVGIYRFFPTI